VKLYESVYARVLGIMAVLGFVLLLVSVTVTIFELLPTGVEPDEWQEIWLRPAQSMREQVVSDLDLGVGPLTAEELGFIAIGFFGIATAVTLIASIPAFFARKRLSLGFLGLLQLLVFAVAIWVSVG
jgi:hypothetical protein